MQSPDHDAAVRERIYSATHGLREVYASPLGARLQIVPETDRYGQNPVGDTGAQNH
jgi:hypothetical protein